MQHVDGLPGACLISDGLIWIGFLGLIPGALAAWILLKRRDDSRGLIPGQAAALATFVVYSLATGLSLLLEKGAWDV